MSAVFSSSSHFAADSCIVIATSSYAPVISLLTAMATVLSSIHCHTGFVLGTRYGVGYFRTELCVNSCLGLAGLCRSHSLNFRDTTLVGSPFEIAIPIEAPGGLLDCSGQAVNFAQLLQRT